MKSFKSLRRAFTLVEIMIVVLIIGILLAIAIPNFIRARESSRAKACVSNLRQLDSAKEQWAMDYRANNGATVALTTLLNVYMDNGSFGTRGRRRAFIEPRCPSTNFRYSLSINPIGTPPDCPSPTTQSGPYAHTLP